MINETESENSWVKWFLDQPEGRCFVRVDSNYMKDSFNLYGIRAKVEHYKLAVDYLREPYVVPSQRSKNYPDNIDEIAKKLYGLIHSRFLMTNQGLQLMHEKYKRKEFENCPNVGCKDTHCLPYGISEEPDQHRVYMYCPSCNDIYIPEDRKYMNIDGSFFGSAYIVAFLHTYTSIQPPSPPELPQFRLFGFKIDLEEEEYDD